MTYSILKYLLKKFITTKTIHLQFKDKEYIIDNNTDPLILKINDDKFLRKLFYAPSLVLAEGYMDKDYELPNSNFYEFSELVLDNYNFYLEKISHNLLFKVFLLINPFFQLNFSKRSKSNVASHYDLSDKLYDLFLDETRQYSCAYFEKKTNTLHQAQLNKMDRLSDKLSLKKNDRVLDIGCGWGSLSRYMTENFGCSIKGISLSEEQIKYCDNKKKKSKSKNNLEYSLQDYRHENNTYNKIVSVGMFEHVGKPFYTTYFKKIYEMLEQDGIAVIHTIGNIRTPKITAAFIRKYIFPGGYIPSLSEIMPAIEKSSLIISDIEVLRLHYAHTLKHWKENCIRNKQKIINMFDEKFFRMWEFYLAGCEMAFKWGEQVVYQFQLAKSYTSTPITRDYIYQ